MTAGAGAAALAAAVVLLPYANAGPEQPGGTSHGHRPLTAPAAAKLGTGLASELGAKGAGWYFDGDSAQLVMNVLDEDAARTVRARGGAARVVANSKAELARATRTLADRASVPGTAWSVDPRTNKVVVLADRTVGQAGMATLNRAAERMQETVILRRSSGTFRPFHGEGERDGGRGGEQASAADGPGDRLGDGPRDGEGAGADGPPSDGGQDAGSSAPSPPSDGALRGGDAIFGAGSRCSLGFNVTAGGAPAFLTAGHCGNAAASWTADQQGRTPLGSVAESRFPGGDFALVRYDDPATVPPGAVTVGDGTQPITRAAEAGVGMEVRRSGSTTGVSDGTVTGLDATVNYGGGDIVTGLIRTDVCAEPGDSGGALFVGDAAVGLTSGGSGDCTQGGETFFQPVTDALRATNAELALPRP